jgi:hypothetical protein
MKTVVALTGIIAAVLCGCSKETEIGGQVFIVRSDRETVRLSGAKVIIGRENEITNKLARLKQEVIQLKEASARELKEFEAQEIALNTELTQEESKLEDAKDAIFKTKVYIEERRHTIESNGGRMQFMPAANRIEQAKINQQWHAQLVKAQQETLPSWQASRAKHEAAIETCKDRLAEVKEKKDMLTKGEPKNLANKYFITEFQSSRCPSTMTDADGRFRINVRLKEKPMIVVRGQRQIAMVGTEYYFWAERITSTNVLLSNENMLEGWQEVSPFLKKLMSSDE